MTCLSSTASKYNASLVRYLLPAVVLFILCFHVNETTLSRKTLSLVICANSFKQSILVVRAKAVYYKVLCNTEYSDSKDVVKINSYKMMVHRSCLLLALNSRKKRKKKKTRMCSCVCLHVCVWVGEGVRYQKVLSSILDEMQMTQLYLAWHQDHLAEKLLTLENDLFNPTDMNGMVLTGLTTTREGDRYEWRRFGTTLEKQASVRATVRQWGGGWCVCSDATCNIFVYTKHNICPQ